MLRILIHRNTHTNLKIKLVIYKILLKPIWNYGLQFWSIAKNSNFSKYFPKKNNSLPSLCLIVSNLTLQNALLMTTILDETTFF